MISCNAKPYEGTDPYLFFSYPRKDAGIVYPLIERLASAGCRIWYDAGIHVGEDWPDVIADHLYHSEACIAFLSENAIQSHNCKNELNYTIELKKALIPIRYNDAAMTKGIQLMLANTQWMNIKGIPAESVISEILNHPSVKKCHGIPDRSIVVQDYQAVVSEQPKEQRPAFSAGINASSLTENEVPSSEPKPNAAGKVSSVNEPTDVQRQLEPIPAEQELPAEPKQKPQVQTEHQAEVQSQALPLRDEEPERPEPNRRSRRRRGLDTSANSQAENVSASPSDFGEKTVAETILTDPLEATVSADALDLDKTIAVSSEFPPVIVQLSNGKKYKGVSNGSVILGRKKEKSQIQIPDPEHTISGAHARITSMNGIHIIKDMNSTNGTWVDGEKLEKDGETQVEGSCEVRLFRERLFVAFDPLSRSLWEAKALLSLRCEDTGEARYLWRNEMKLGRHHKWKDGVFEDNKVGREHAAILAVEDGFVLKDRSMNGTWLNREKMEKDGEAKLTNGDVIQIGNWQFVVSVIPLEGENEA